jgi:hypothetical protein
MSHETQATYIGSLGVALLLLAFLLNLARILRSDSCVYSTLNSIGAALACYSSYLINFLPFVILEGVWSIVAVVALMRKALRE